MNSKKKLWKRGYYFPPELLEAWERFHLSSKDYSPSAAGAFVVWMTLESSVRESIKKTLFSQRFENALDKIREIVKESVIEAGFERILDKLPATEKKQLLNKWKKKNI